MFMQGGPYNEEQIKEFEKDPLYELKIQVRRWDDGAKIVGWEVPDLESYRPMAINHLLAQRKQPGVVA
jgi:predicted HD phosphohydrolase